MPKPKNPNPHFRFVFVDLPGEWQAQINNAYKEFALKQVELGKTPRKTDFVRYVFAKFLNLQ